jgi:hypothetical protein
VIRGHSHRLLVGSLCLALWAPSARAEEAVETSAVVEEDAPPAPPKPAEPAEPAVPKGPVDVFVEGEQDGEAEDDTESGGLGPREVSRMPGAFGDAFRAVDALPGVAPMASGLPHLFVRGATPSASGYFIDGIRVPFLFHLVIGPSVINPAIIDDVRFYSGAAPARFGRQVGGIVEATTRAPAEQLRLEGNIRIFDAGAFAEVPLFDNRVTVMGGARYAYTGPLFSLVAPDTTLGYWDYQGALWYNISDRDRVGVFAFGSRDDLSQIDEDTGEDEDLFGVEFHRIHLRLERTARPRGTSQGPLGASARLGFTVGIDRSVISDEARVDARSYQLRSDVEVPVLGWLRLRGGLDLLAEEYEFESREDEKEEEPPDDGDDPPKEDDEFDFNVAKAFKSRETGTVGAYFDAVVQPIDAIEIIPGIRVDAYAEEGATQVAVDPRGFVRLRATDWLASVTGIGLAHQKPTLLVSIPGLDPIGLGDGLQEALQVSQGVELSFPEDVEASLTGFWHRYSDLTDLSATCSVGVESCTAADRADGKAYGFELMLRRSLSARVGGILSYTFSRTERTFEEQEFLADFDRTHIINLALGVDLGRGWHVGARFAAYSGRPYSLIKFDDPDKPTEPTLVGERNALRRDWFYRLDARIEKRWVIAERGWVSFIVEGFNVTLQKETVDFDCRVAEVLGSQAGLNCGGQEIGPISIPSLGVAGGI